MCHTQSMIITGSDYMANLYISDLHLGHKNVIRFDGRPFENVDEMDHQMIEMWNMRVSDDDNIYILGDFWFRGSNGPVWYLKKLKGKKHLVLGNHDDKLVKYQGALEYFESVDKMMIVDDNGRTVHLSHFPICEWHGYYRDSYHLYGHIHNRLNSTCLIMRHRKNAYNAGCMINNYMPCTLDEIIANNKRFEAEHPLSWADLLPEERF